jgi:hypothetical protein
MSDIPPGRCTEELDGIVPGPPIFCRHVHGHAGAHESTEGTVWWLRPGDPASPVRQAAAVLSDAELSDALDLWYAKRRRADREPLKPFVSWQEQTSAVEALAKAAGLDDEPCGYRSAYVHDHGCTKFARAAVPVGGGAPGDGLREQDCGHYSWAGLMRLLDEEWPADIFPTRYVDDPERDAGPRIVSLMRWVQDITAERDTLAAALDRVRALADQWGDMARDHDEQGASTTAIVYRAHARLIRRALDDT